MMQTTIDYNFNGITLKVEADVSPYVAAKIYGPAEDCHPEEGGEVDLTSVTCNGAEFEYESVTDCGIELEELIKNMVWEEVNQPEEERY